MPSNFVQAANSGLGRCISSASGNRTSSVIKIPGTATLQGPNITKVPVYGISVLDGSSNDGITNTLVSSTGQTGSALAYAIGSAIGTVDVVRKQVELSISDPNSRNRDPLHNKVYDREVVYTASGYYHNIHGVVFQPTGGAVNLANIATATGYYGNDQGNLGPTSAQPYYFRNGILNKEIDLPARTQV